MTDIACFFKCWHGDGEIFTKSWIISESQLEYLKLQNGVLCFRFWRTNDAHHFFRFSTIWSFMGAAAVP